MLIENLRSMLLYLYFLRSDDAFHYAFLVDDERGAECSEVCSAVHFLLAPYAESLHESVLGVGNQ